jgi:hypothetical protein
MGGVPRDGRIRRGDNKNSLIYTANGYKAPFMLSGGYESREVRKAVNDSR